MQRNFDDSLRLLLQHEGGYTNHPSDPGGPTNFGITIHDYRKYVDRTADASDVKAMSVDTAKEIYRHKYWDAVRGDRLPDGVDFAVFDYAVNSGVSRAAKVLQRLVGADPDGLIGPKTLAAISQIPLGGKELVDEICDERLAFLHKLRTWPVFGKGWGRRVIEVRQEAKKMIDRGG